MNRMAFLIDGFNLYHSLVDARHAGVLKPTRWLDLRALCAWVMPQFDPGAALGPIHYFSALASHVPEKVSRHNAYISCLKATDITVELGSFMRKDSRLCPNCGVTIPGPREEKMSDVGIGVRLIELFVRARCDSAVLISGDTDQVPTIKTARGLFPQARAAGLVAM